jgi:hypothetical protein
MVCCVVMGILMVGLLFRVFYSWVVDSASAHNLRFDQYEWEVKVTKSELKFICFP